MSVANPQPQQPSIPDPSDPTGAGIGAFLSQLGSLAQLPPQDPVSNLASPLPSSDPATSAQSADPNAGGSPFSRLMFPDSGPVKDAYGVLNTALTNLGTQQGAANQVLQHAYSQQLPPVQRPKVGTPDAIKLGLGLLLNALVHGGAAGMRGLIGGYAGGLENTAQLQHERQMQQYQQGLTQAQLQSQGLRDTAQFGVEQAQTGVQHATQMYDLQRGDYYKGLMLQQNATAKAETAVNMAQRNYDFAKTLPAKLSAASQLRSAIGQMQRYAPEYAGTAPTDDQAKQDFAGSVVLPVSKELSAEMTKSADQFGEIPASQATDLESRIQGLASQFGIDRSLLPSVPTGATLKKQAMDNQVQQFQQRYGDIAGKSPAMLNYLRTMGVVQYQKQRIAQGWANVQQAIQRGEIASSNNALGWANSEINKFRATSQAAIQSARVALGAQTAGGKYAPGSVNATIAGLQQQIGAMKSDDPNYAKVNGELQKWVGVRNYLQQQTQTDPDALMTEIGAAKDAKGRWSFPALQTAQRPAQGTPVSQQSAQAAPALHVQDAVLGQTPQSAEELSLFNLAHHHISEGMDPAWVKQKLIETLQRMRGS